ncbi:MAG: type II secretion system ATPase GspE [Gammaproteobacteria bacterium]|nr:type II secretion system ATPase GspE [Gammaproteobacteria bacterium]
MNMADPKLPYSFAKRFGVIVQLSDNGQKVLLHKANTPISAFAEITRLGFHDVGMQEVSEDEFDQRLAANYQQGGAAADIMDDIGDSMNLDEIAESLGEPEDLMESQDDAPVIRLINAMLTEAIRHQASDIHIEPFENSLNIRYRVDGIMRDLLNPPRKLAPLIISRLKVMSKLDIAEKRVPQDGRISLRVAGRAVDVRVSTLPSGHGERVVLRLLDKQAGKLDLANLGMAEGSRNALEALLKIPHGILLVTGPTGSGKTTTLYAALSRLNTQRNTILTVEDPVEYHIEGIGQTQVNPKVDLDFARGLRAILRQDPDIVMVGEIRDLETAEIAVQASLTGHMVLSTLHTNTAVGAVTRLRDMGVEPFLLSSSLIGVVAQRLVRRLCEHCKQPHQPDDREIQWLGHDYSDHTIYGAKGCEHCNYSGYSGRSGVYEVTPINGEMRTLIHDGASEAELEAKARAQTPSIADDGRRLVLEGLTSVEEVLRVIRER